MAPGQTALCDCIREKGIQRLETVWNKCKSIKLCLSSQWHFDMIIEPVSHRYHWETENKGLDEVGCKERLGKAQNYPEMFLLRVFFLSFLQRDKVRSDTKNVAGIG